MKKLIKCWQGGKMKEEQMGRPTVRSNFIKVSIPPN